MNSLSTPGQKNKSPVNINNLINDYKQELYFLKRTKFKNYKRISEINQAIAFLETERDRVFRP